MPQFPHDRLLQDPSTGRVLALAGNGEPIGRAMYLRNDEWFWTQKAHLVEDFSLRELADAVGLTLSGYLLSSNLGKPDYVEAVLSMFNKVQVANHLGYDGPFVRSPDWRTILDNWEGTRARLHQGVIPYEEALFDRRHTDAVASLLDFATKYDLPVVGKNLFQWGQRVERDLRDASLSSLEKRRVIEFVVKAKVNRSGNVGGSNP